MGLNEKQIRFVQEYLVDLNATQAATRAGYSARTAHALASRLLKNVKVQQAVDAAMKARANRTTITQDRVLWELARIGFADVTEVVSIQNGRVQMQDTCHLSDDTRRSISEISEVVTEGGDRTIKVKFHSKVAALTQLARHLGLDRPALQYDDAVERMANDPDPERIDRGDDVSSI